MEVDQIRVEDGTFQKCTITTLSGGFLVTNWLAQCA